MPDEDYDLRDLIRYRDRDRWTLEDRDMRSRLAEWEAQLRLERDSLRFAWGCYTLVFCVTAGVIVLTLLTLFWR